MKILIICPLVPYPLVDGASKSVYYPIKVLAERGHEVHLACLTEKIKPESVRALERYCVVDVVESPKKPTVVGALRSLLSSTPYDMHRFHNRELLDRIRKKVTDSHFDVLQAEGIHSAHYALEVRKDHDIPLLLRVNTIQHMNLLRSVGTYANPLINLYLMVEGRKVRRYEVLEGRKFDLNLVISDHDGEVLRRLDPGIACMTIPAGVDLNEFNPGTTDPDPNTVLWMGALSWPPNRDSFWWFYNQIVPHLVRRVPDVKIHIVGSSPPEDILALRHPHVQVHGFVPDISEALRRAAVCVVPLQVGSGIRVKLLEMFAMKKAVVCTSIGAEGLHLENGKQLLLADSPDAFAEAVARLLADSQLRTMLSGNAYRHVQDSYTWEKMGPLYEDAYRRVIQAYDPARG
jgi:glycosyltransferase involved in cell wall biosynthesis